MPQHFLALSHETSLRNNWKFVTESDPLWKQIIIRKSGDEDKGWCSRGVRGGYTVGV